MRLFSAAILGPAALVGALLSDVPSAPAPSPPFPDPALSGSGALCSSVGPPQEKKREGKPPPHRPGRPPAQVKGRPEKGREGSSPPPPASPVMSFKKGVVLGKPVKEGCTLRCHIDFPFSLRKFRHDVHGPAAGFRCRICHEAVPVGRPEHGRIRLKKGGCTSCHHNRARFPECTACHEPVEKTIRVGELSFDHRRHADAGGGAYCILCHEDPPAEKRRPAAWPLERCLACHHSSRRPVPCKRCHSGVSEEKAAGGRGIEGFDHRLRASAALGGGRKLSCEKCHLVPSGVVVPEKLPCAACHHPSDPGLAPPCVRCHSGKAAALRVKDPSFDHALHTRAVENCMTCHGKDPGRSPDRGRDCARCHHEKTEECRRCHASLLEFERVPPGGKVAAPFRHAPHQARVPCLSCHAPGARLSAPLSSRDCTSCHHYGDGGGGTTCGRCHPEAAALRRGEGGGLHAAPDPMEGSVSCTDCHPAPSPEKDGAARRGVVPCSRCHPPEYDDLMTARMQALERASAGTQGLPLSPSMGIHNYPLAMDLIRLHGTRAAEKGNTPPGRE